MVEIRAELTLIAIEFAEMTALLDYKLLVFKLTTVSMLYMKVLMEESTLALFVLIEESTITFYVLILLEFAKVLAVLVLMFTEF